MFKKTFTYCFTTEHSLQTLSFLATSRDYTIPGHVGLCYLIKKKLKIIVSEQFHHFP